MGMTIVEKILARAGGMSKVSPGDYVVVNVYTVVLIERERVVLAPGCRRRGHRKMNGVVAGPNSHREMTTC